MCWQRPCVRARKESSGVTHIRTKRSTASPGLERRGRMIEHATPDAPPNATDLFEIIRTTRSMRRLKPDPASKFPIGRARP